MSPSMPDVKNWMPDRESHEPTTRSHIAARSSGMGEKILPPRGASPPAEAAAPRSEKAASPLHAVSQTPRLSSEPHARMQISEPIAAPSTLLPSPFSVTAPAPDEGIKKQHVSIAPADPGRSPSPSQRASSLDSSFLLPPAPPPTWRWHVQDVAPYSYGGPALPDVVSPPPSSSAKAKKPVFPLLPPPPPNTDCESFTCSEPYTNTPSGSPCGCVVPIHVGLRLSVALYTFFPLVSELASEIAIGVFMKVSQVHVMGAIADNYQQEKTVVRIDLVPPKQAFDANTACSVYEKFWHKEIAIKSELFGGYEVLYIRYPGLPPPPPSAVADTTLNGEPSIPGNYSGTFKPLGVNVRQQRNKWRGSFIAIVALSSAIALVLCLGATWFFNFKRRESRGHYQNSISSPWALALSFTKPSGVGSPLSGSGLNSSFSSSIATYTGSAKTFTLNEMGKATNNFNPARVLGEGGFGRVYSGALEDGTKVAVKVLKREDRQGGKEFLAEVEMLNRLHHRNLVKLIGICVEEHNRCLVYELVPNGSVESHLHGMDKELAPLDWSARMKIALGSARGLAYLHEDSSPRVIHRDFKSSNILLEDDFTPKVSDFGLARAALTDGNEHISTRVVGTFGYVAPEYAMTGHLLVKSDVYSYGVVLLELLTGRKPVDMSQPQGRENLVSWAHPLLTSREGLEMIVDPALSGSYPFDSVAKVAAIASMCVQPEVSNRPFMGEVVQALKLVCSEADEMYSGSENYSQEQLSLHDFDIITSSSSSVYLNHSSSFAIVDCRHNLECSRILSASDILSSSMRFVEPVSDSFRRHPVSGPLRPNRS
ncbi:Receptor-like serine/threonine-protein kinase [Nymphaea thermarum]|nr:Receptor-like serine/threonine-protein kinase [Nymphaea thermarum]